MCDLAVLFQALHHAFGGRGDRACQRIHALQFEMRAFGKVLADAIDQIHFVARETVGLSHNEHEVERRRLADACVRARLPGLPR